MTSKRLPGSSLISTAQDCPGGQLQCLLRVCSEALSEFVIFFPYSDSERNVSVIKRRK